MHNYTTRGISTATLAPRHSQILQQESATPHRSIPLKAALGYAKRGIPVFRLRPGTKEPFHGSRGFYDATTDEAEIKRMFGQAPTANLGMRTGRESRILVVDEDKEGTFGELEREIGPQPETWTVSTPSGGLHFYYRLPEGEAVSCSVRDSLDVRGDGGYVVLPPSRTEDGEYRVVKRIRMAEATPELIEWARSRRSTGKVRDTPKRTESRAPTAGEPIPEGQRNTTLFFEALGLKDAGENRERAYDAVHAINESRCSPPLAADEVEKIVNSAFRYPIRGELTPPEVMEAVEALNRAWWTTAWRGVGGKTERDVMMVLIKMAERYGRLVEGGVRFTLSWRTLALVAACSFRTVSRVVRRLEARGWLKPDNEGRSGTEAGAFVLLPRSGGITQSTGYRPLTNVPASDVTSARLPQETPCFRWRGLVGKGRAGVLYALEVFGPQSKEELAERLGWAQVRDLRTRYLVPLIDLGLVDERGGVFALPGDHRERVEEVRGIEYGGGERKVREKDTQSRWVSTVKYIPPKSEIEREAEDRREYERQRRKYRTRLPESDESCRKVLNDMDREREAAGGVRDITHLREVIVPAEMSNANPENNLEPSTRVAHHEPEMVYSAYIHPPECSCDLCSHAPEPRYARARVG